MDSSSSNWKNFFSSEPREAKFFPPSGIRLCLPRHLTKQGGLFTLDQQPTIATMNSQASTLNYGLVGESAVMRALHRQIRTAARCELSVLVCGESGTGKELVARAIHLQSSRAKKPFISLNCGTLTETLLESELFGYERGAFTGAHQKK
jgi:transcriptional regulator with GAF, ATPase, and Fis domain